LKNERISSLGCELFSLTKCARRIPLGPLLVQIVILNDMSQFNDCADQGPLEPMIVQCVQEKSIHGRNMYMIVSTADKLCDTCQ